MKLTLTIKMDESFKKLAEALPPMQIEVAGVAQTIKGKPLFVNHHAEILCHYSKGGKRAVGKYVKGVIEKQKQSKNKLTVVK